MTLPLPDPVRAAMRSAFGLSCRVTVDTLGEVPVTRATYKASLDGEITRSLSVDLAGEDFGSTAARDLLDAIWQAGGRLTCEAVISVPGQPDEVVPVGRYQVQKATWLRSARQGFTLDCLGLGSLLRDHRFDAPRTVGPEQARALAETLVRETIPTASVLLGSGVTDTAVAEGSTDEDRLGLLWSLALATGALAFYERHDGDFEFRAGTGDTISTDAVVVGQDTGYDRADVWNGVRARSTHEDHQDLYAWAQDLDAGSPTYWLGPFGKRPRFYASPLITTAEQAQATADSLLDRHKGRRYQVGMDLVPDPTVEPGDLADVDVGYGVESFRVVEVACPLQPGDAMALTLEAV